MCKALPWHALAKSFLISEFPDKYEIRKEPIELHSSGKLKIVSQVISANHRALLAEKELGTLKQTIVLTLNQHQEQMDEFKKILLQHENKLNPNKKIDNIISSPAYPKQSFLVNKMH